MASLLATSGDAFYPVEIAKKRLFVELGVEAQKIIAVIFEM